MSLLEQRYRTVLRLLPRAYRAEREEEMVAAFLEIYDAPDEENPRPGWGEIASILRLAIRVRLTWTGRAVAWGESLRDVALLGLGLQAALAGPSLVMLGLSKFAGVQPEEPLLLTLILLTSVAWVVAFVALARGSESTARPIALAALAATAAEVGYGLTENGPYPAQLAFVGVLLVAAISVAALLLGRLHNARPVVLSRRRIVAVLLAGLLQQAVWLGLGVWTILGLSWVAAEGLATLFIVGLATAEFLRRRVRAPRLLALGILAVPVLLSRLLGLLPTVTQPELVGEVLAQIALLAPVTALAWIFGLRRLPRLPKAV